MTSTTTTSTCVRLTSPLSRGASTRGSSSTSCSSSSCSSSSAYAIVIDYTSTIHAYAYALYRLHMHYTCTIRICTLYVYYTTLVVLYYFLTIFVYVYILYSCTFWRFHIRIRIDGNVFAYVVMDFHGFRIRLDEPRRNGQRPHQTTHNTTQRGSGRKLGW